MEDRMEDISINTDIESYFPETGYNLIKISYPESTYETVRINEHSLRLSGISVPDPTGHPYYFVYDSIGNQYTPEELGELPECDDSAETADVGEIIQLDDQKQQRIALARFAASVKKEPQQGLDAVPILTSELDQLEIELQTEAIYILSKVANEYPEQITSATEEVLGLLNQNAHSEIVEVAIDIVAAVAEYNPEAVIDVVPTFAMLLQEESSPELMILVSLKRIADEYPEAVVPITPDLISYTEQGDVANRTVAIAVLGVIAKEYPNIAKETVPTAIELLDAEHHMLQTNAAGLLADLSEEYPTVTRPCVPRAIELLENDNKKVRYNATSILSRIAKVHPEDVEPAIPALIEALEDEHDYSRVNASWALGYLEANEALDILKERSQDDTNEEVRHAANKAIQMIVEDSC